MGPGGGAAGLGAELGPCPLPGGHGAPASPLQDLSPPGRKPCCGSVSR